MTLLHGISDVESFNLWVSKSLLTKQSYFCQAGKAKSDATKQPINKVFDNILSIPVTVKTAHILQLNIFRACYLACEAETPDKDIHAQSRTESQDFLTQLPVALESVKSLVDFITRYRYLSAIAITETNNSEQVSTPSDSGFQRLSMLGKLIDDLEAGLLDFKNDNDHIALISGSDFTYGPFDLSIDLNKEWKSKGVSSVGEGVNIIETGLMFHLTYLFRFFSTENPDQNFTSFFNENILMLDSVRMIKTGKPQHHLVALIVNAVFDTKYSSTDVKDRLNSIKKPKANSKVPPVFIGW